CGGDLRLRQVRAAEDPVSVLRRGLDWDRIPGWVADDVQRNDAGGRGNLSQRAAALRRREAESLERAGMRASLCAGDVGLERGGGAERAPLSRRRAGGRDQGAGGTSLFLGDGDWLGRVPGDRVRRDDSRGPRLAASPLVYGEWQEIVAGPDDSGRRG